MVNTAVLVSGGGTNLQALIDAKARGELPGCNLCAVISSSPEAYALKRAESAGIPGIIVNRREFEDRAAFDSQVAQAIRDSGAELIVLAGFMFVLNNEISGEYKNRIINVHPALIPSFCGMGYYGLRVHRAVLEAGVKVTGATVHFVDAGVDSGPIILQKAVDVLPGDTPESLQQRVMREAEWVILPKAVSLYSKGMLDVIDNRVMIKKHP